MLWALTKRMLQEPDKRLVYRFLYNFGWKGGGAMRRFEARLRHGEVFPPFLFLSLTNACNLSCRGCWVTPSRPPRELEPDTVDRVIEEGRRRGCHFYGILGGEPLLYESLFNLFERHRDCYFQLFSNGVLLTDAVARELNRLGNVTPLISIEGREEVSDERRGGRNVYARAMAALEHCRRSRLIFGVATSVCQSNIAEVATEEFVNEMVARGAHYIWYYIYRPVGGDPAPELALTPEQIVALRRFLVDVRTRAPILVVDAYWDADGRGLCPAAMGISHHVAPTGDIEPCPPIQFALDNVRSFAEGRDPFTKSAFLAGFRSLAQQTTRGCILLENPDVLRRFLVEQGARDTSGRGTGLAELARMSPCASHHVPGQEIPEKHWMYRWAKRNWFFGFGAYG